MAVVGTCSKPSPFLLPTAGLMKDCHSIIACRGHQLRFRNIFKHKQGLSASILAVPRAAVNCDRDAATETMRPVKRHSVSMWDDVLLSPTNQIKNCVEEVDTLKKQVRRMVVDKEAKPEDKMILIDTLERLGVAYHFEQEIEEQVAQIFELQQRKTDEDSDLFTTSLHFRIFRLHGYNVPCSVFNKFKDDDGTFKEALTNDIKGLLSLYEATYVRFRQEDILDEANVFATHFLKYAMPLLDSCLQERVKRALSHPIHRTHARLEARHYISIYDTEESKNELLLKFAKMDFNLLQNLHKREISKLMRWWRHLDISSKLPYIRNRVVEAYFWATLNLDSRDSFPRLCAAKCLLLFIIINDTFDSYATFEEAKKFVEILHQRWDSKKIDQLPNYMQIAYKVILNAFEEFDQDTSKQGRGYAAHYAKEAVRRIADGYLKTAGWYLGHETPTFHKCVSNGLYDSGVHAVVASYFMGMESVSEETFEWLMSGPTFVEASGQYARYLNDIASYEREHKAGKLPNTSIDCYMKEYRVSKEAAVAKLRELSEDAWKAMNWEWISTTCVPREYLKLVVNYARIAHVSYSEGSDGLTNPERGLNNDIAALFIYPITIIN